MLVGVPILETMPNRYRINKLTKMFSLIKMVRRNQLTCSTLKQQPQPFTVYYYRPQFPILILFKASSTLAFFSKWFCNFAIFLGLNKQKKKIVCLLILECLFSCFKDREAFQIEILSFGMLPGLLNKQTNTLKLTKKHFHCFLSNLNFATNQAK